jgi:diamine N-acetyltransferase
MRISYRRWELKDVDNIRQLLHDTWIGTYSEFVPREDINEYLEGYYSQDILHSFFIDKNVVGFIAEVDGEVAGYEKTFYNREENRLYVQQLYILPRYQKSGLGKQLITFAAEHAQTFDLDRIWLAVMVKNTPALLWYQNMGYQIMDKTPFTLGKTKVEHYVGYVPVADIFQFCENK